MPDEQPTGTAERPARSGRRPAGAAGLLLGGALLAPLIALALVVLAGSAAEAVAGLQDPGVVTTYGVTVVRVLARLAALVVVGSLLLAAFLVPPQPSGTLAADGYGALRTAGFAAWAWAVLAIAAAYFEAADDAGLPVTAVVAAPGDFLVLVDAIDEPKAWLLTALAALVVAVGCRVVLSWGWTAALFGISVVGLLPVAITGHSASGGSHDVATDSLLFHIVAASLWVGGLIALVALARRARPQLSLAVQRFSRLALVCWIIMAVSGVVNALVRVAPAELLSSEYGLLVLAKITALGVLGVFGHQQRTRGVRLLTERGTRATFVRLAGVEVLVMFATFGLAAALARTPYPSEITKVPSRAEVLIGYDLDGPLTVAKALFDWRFDLIYGSAAVGLAIAYLLGVRRLRRRGDAWPVGRTVAWLAGCATVLVATSSGIGKYAPAQFSVHMAGHMLLAMVAPILLVLGGAVTLTLRAIPPAGKGAPPGPREWVLAAMHAPVTRLLTHPLVALALFAGSFYLLYFTGLFGAALSEHWAHLAMNAHFLVVGYLFFWLLIGVDPAPHRLMPLGRIGLMFASMPFHALFGVMVMGSATVIGEQFYRALDLPWVGSLLDEQHFGGGMAWAFGEIPALLVLVALMAQWARADERAARRADRRSDAADDELAAYNAMLKQLADHSSGGTSSQP